MKAAMFIPGAVAKSKYVYSTTDFKSLVSVKDKLEFVQFDLRGRFDTIRAGIFEMSESPGKCRNWPLVAATAVAARQVFTFLGFQIGSGQIKRYSPKAPHAPTEVTYEALGGSRIPIPRGLDATSLITGMLAAHREVAHLTYDDPHHLRRSGTYDNGASLQKVLVDFCDALLRISTPSIQALEAKLKADEVSGLQ